MLCYPAPAKMLYNIIRYIMETKKYNFLTIGFDCSPASALRELDLREYALPFDWIESNIRALERCFADNFARFHTGLRISPSRTRIIDVYGFQYPHDYPVIDENNNEPTSAIVEKKIVENWKLYYDDIKRKYNRRIDRFIQIMRSPLPILVLCRYSVDDTLKIRGMLNKYYNKSNVMFITSTKTVSNVPYVRTLFTEKNDIWNETAIWKEAVDSILTNPNWTNVFNRNMGRHLQRLIIR